MLHKKKQNVYKKSTLGPTAGHGVTTLPCCRLWPLHCHKRSGTASVEKRKKLEEWMSPWYDSDDWISNVFFLTLEEQNRVTTQAKRTFSLLSHTPANRNECPCCKHFLTTPANTSILSLSLKNQNFKFVTLTRAPSQPVALFFQIFNDQQWWVLVFIWFQLQYSIRKPFEDKENWNKKNGNKNFWIKKHGFQNRGLINNVLAKRFINPVGPPVFKFNN